jgi:hypothetical protein
MLFALYPSFLAFLKVSRDFAILKVPFRAHSYRSMVRQLVVATPVVLARQCQERRVCVPTNSLGGHSVAAYSEEVFAFLRAICGVARGDSSRNDGSFSRPPIRRSRVDAGIRIEYSGSQPLTRRIRLAGYALQTSVARTFDGTTVAAH